MTIPITLVDQVQIGTSTNYRGAYQEGHQIEMLRDAPQPAMEAETLLHEILHSVFYNQQMHIDPDLKNSHEKIVAQISSGLIAVLKDNPKLIDYFKRALR